MKRTNVYLDEEQSRVLRHLAIEEGRSFTDIVREALNEYLQRRGLDVISRISGPRGAAPEGEWEARLHSALQRLRSRIPSDVGPDEIEAEITAARAEVRKGSANRGRVGGGQADAASKI